MSERQECQVCKMPLEEGCQNGTGVPPFVGGGIIRVIQPNGEIVGKTCPNMKRVRIRRHLEEIDPQLVAPGMVHEPNSPLFRPKEGDQEKVDLTSTNLLIPKIKWGAFLPHLKWVAAFKGTEFFIRIVTDMTLINVYVGNANFKARLKSQQEEGDLLIANSLEDLLQGPDLVIIRLGQIHHPNKAAANVLSEALSIRSGKATWLVEPHDKAFDPYQKNEYGLSLGMVCCNDAVRGYVDANFKRLPLKGKVVKVKEDAPVVVRDEEDGTVSIGEESLSEFNEAAEDLPEAAEPVSEEPMAELWSESPKKKGGYGKKKKGGWS